MVHPLYNYGLPVTMNVTGTPATITGAEVEPGSSMTPHTPPANTSKSFGTSGSPSEELGLMYLPVLTTIAPTTAVSGGANFALTCTGSGYQPSTSGAASVINFNGDPKPTTYASATSISTTITPPPASTPGTATVTVSNAGVVSAPKTFTYT